MIKGTRWVPVKFWHDEDDATEYLVKVYYEHEGGWFEDHKYNESHRLVEIVEYPQNASQSLMSALNERIQEMSDEIIDLHVDDGDHYEPDPIDEYIDKSENQ